MKGIIILLFIFNLHALQQDMPVKQIKQWRRSVNGFAEMDTAKVYSVSGYYYKSAMNLLLTDPSWMNINTRMPDSVYLILSGDKITQMNENINKYQGKFIRLFGKINFSKDEKLKGIDFIVN